MHKKQLALMEISLKEQIGFQVSFGRQLPQPSLDSSEKLHEQNSVSLRRIQEVVSFTSSKYFCLAHPQLRDIMKLRNHALRDILIHHSMNQ